MPNWNEVQKEIQLQKGSPLDQVRKKYLKHLFDLRKRNIITYYSGFLQKQGNFPIGIYDGDINALMNAVKGLDFSRGLDLILHTPGGQVAATEVFVDYLHKIFGDNIHCFVPQLAMSGGTMIACSCQRIYMGKQSSIGPIDPQFGSIAAHGVIEEYEFAKDEIKKTPSSIPLWQTVYSKINPAFIIECHHALKLSEELITNWLKQWMFKDDPSADETVKKIVKELNDHSTTKSHGRHISASKAKEMGLKIIDLEDDNELQDLVLTVHHAYMETFNQTNAIKIVENHKDAAYFININQNK